MFIFGNIQCNTPLNAVSLYTHSLHGMLMPNTVILYGMMYLHRRVLMPCFILLLMMSCNHHVIKGSHNSFDARSIIIATFMWSVIVVRCVTVLLESLLSLSYDTSHCIVECFTAHCIILY